LWSGDPGEGEVVAPLRQYRPPAVDLISPVPYVGFRQLQDELCPTRRPAHMKSGYLDELSVGPRESAFWVRDAAYCFNMVAAWDDPAETETHIGWARRTYDALEPVARKRTYVNQNIAPVEGH
jgi:hypothetical protein